MPVEIKKERLDIYHNMVGTVRLAVPKRGRIGEVAVQDKPVRYALYVLLLLSVYIYFCFSIFFFEENVRP